MQDSLQVSKLSPKRKSVSPSAKDDKQRAIFQQIKQKFITALLKLQSSQTRQIGIQQIRVLVDRNRQPQFLRLYLSVMKSLKIEGTSSSTKQHQILVFSILAQKFKENLVDPIDKPTSRVKTCFRIIQILHSYFKQTTNTVQQACARVLIDLGKHVLGAQTENPSLDTQTYLTLLFTPLTSILKSGVDKASQSTASVCINQQIQYWKAHSSIPKYREMLSKISQQMLTVSLKLNCQYHQIFMALQTIIQMKGLQFFGGKIVQFVSKILGVINKIGSKGQQQHPDASNFNAYMCKVHVCGILEKIGQLIRERADVKAKLDQLDVVPCLEKAARNRVIQVQMAASRAIRVWNGQLLSPDNKDKRPSSTPKISGGSRNHIMSLEQARNIKKRQRSGSKQQKLKLQRQLNHIQQDLHKLVKGGWGPHNRANNFVKKNTGVGGGYCSKMDDSPSPGKVNKSHKQHIEQLRKFIKQSSKQHGTKDKFVFYQQRPTSNIQKSQKSNDERNDQSFKNRRGSEQREQRDRKQQGNRKEQREEKKIVNPKSEQDGQFVLDQNAGDQFVNMGPPGYNYKNHYAQSDASGRFDTEDKQWLAQNKQQLQRINSQDLDGVMSESQMRQLLRQQKQKQMLDIQSKPQIQSKLTVKQQKQLPQSTNKKVANQLNQMTFNKKQQFKKATPDPKIERRNSKSQQQNKDIKYQTQNKKPLKVLDAQQLIKQNPLDNKQLKKVQANNMKNTKQKQVEINNGNNIKLNDDKNGLYVRWSPTKARIDEAQFSIEGSQKMSESIAIADIMNQSDFEGLGWNPFKPKQNKRVSSEQAHAPYLNFAKRKESQNQHKQKDDQYKDSLVLSLSRGDSRSRSPPKPETNTLNKGSLNKSKKSQFSLNPKPQQDNAKKFNSFAQNNSDGQQQILDESKYEQSLPHGQRLLGKPQPYIKQNIEDYYKKSVEHGYQIDKRAQTSKQGIQTVDNRSQVYQQMIKNPPRSHISHRLDKASHIGSQKQQKLNKQQDYQEEEAENITYTWERVLEHVQHNQLNQAYSLTLEMDDPLYLLRLMLITQTPLKKLTPANTRKLWQKFLEIYQHRFIDNIFVQMFSTAQKLGGGKGLNRSLSIEQTNQLLVELYELSGRTKGKLSFGAASLYNEIQQSINNKNERY